MKRIVVIVAVLVFLGVGQAAVKLVLLSSDKIAPGASRVDVIAQVGQPTSSRGPIGYPEVELWSYDDGTQVVLLDGVVVDAFYESN